MPSRLRGGLRCPVRGEVLCQCKAGAEPAAVGVLCRGALTQGQRRPAQGTGSPGAGAGGGRGTEPRCPEGASGLATPQLVPRARRVSFNF